MQRLNSFYAAAMVVLFTTFTFASEDAGVFKVVKGNISIVRDGVSIKAKIGAKVKTKDSIVADKDSRAKLIMNDKNEISISPESKLELEKYVFNASKDEKNVMLNLVYGKVRSSVKQKYDGEKNSFQIKTPSAVAGVRGTDFFVGFNSGSGQSQIVTFEGKVWVGNGLDSSGKITRPVEVLPGQITQVSKVGALPTPPVKMNPAQLLNLETESNPEKADSKSSNSETNNSDAANKEKEESKEDPKKEENKNEEVKDEKQNKEEGKNSDKKEEKRSEAEESKSPEKKETVAKEDKSESSNSRNPASVPGAKGPAMAIGTGATTGSSESGAATSPSASNLAPAPAAGFLPPPPPPPPVGLAPNFGNQTNLNPCLSGGCNTNPVYTPPPSVINGAIQSGNATVKIIIVAPQ